uniref:Katanin_con80 domain-containing protein n=1 Tax=Caenorhabditis tropicalis TaxID=1561998 RepID=A0A1I7TVX9_9PELO
MLGTYRSKQSSATDSKSTSKATKSRTATSKTVETGPKTRSASSRRAQEQPITITYLGRSRTASESDLAANSSSTRSRRLLPSNVNSTSATVLATEEKQGNLSSSTSTDSCSITSSSIFTSFIKTVNQIGAVAKRENKHIRRLKTIRNRRPNSYEKDVASDERLVFTTIQLLTNNHLWSLNSCHEFLPVIIESITSQDKRSQSIALNGLEAIADMWLDRIIQFAREQTNRIGVDVAAEERAKKAKNCVDIFREIVKNRDAIYKQLDEESVFKLDGILALLKKT